MGEPSLIALIFHAFAIILLLVHLSSDDKKYFLFSVLSILVGSGVFILFGQTSSQSLWFLGAIIFSFIGDLFMAEYLKLFDQRIVNGIISFGMAHIFYIIAFNSYTTSSFELWQLIFGLLVLLIVYRIAVYNPSLSNILKISSFIYATIISILFVVILNFAYSNGIVLESFISIAGISLFIISDSIIAYSEFKGNIKNGPKIIAATYILSQILLQSILIVVVV